MKVTTDTSEFERSHGKKPRGRGLWVMQAHVSRGMGTATLETHFGNGTLSEVREGLLHRVRSEFGSTLESVVVVVKP